jgi:hypothetical protein
VVHVGTGPESCRVYRGVGFFGALRLTDVALVKRLVVGVVTATAPLVGYAYLAVYVLVGVTPLVSPSAVVVFVDVLVREV